MKLFSVCKLFVISAVLVFAGLLSPAPASADAICNSLDIVTGNTPPNSYYNGETVHFFINVLNPVCPAPAITGTATNVVIKFFKPEADGLPNLSGTPFFTDTIASLAPGDTKYYDIPVALALNPEVTVARAEATYIGTVVWNTTSGGSAADAHGRKDIAVGILTYEIPEFGLIPGLIALVSSGAGFIFLKRRHN